MATVLLTAEERRRLRAHLAGEREAAQRRLGGLDRTFDELVAAADLEPPDDEHDPDGTTAYERAQVTSLANATRTVLRQLDLALDQLDDPGFGACTACGQPIGVARLEAVPGTTRCVRCAALGTL